MPTAIAIEPRIGRFDLSRVPFVNNRVEPGTEGGLFNSRAVRVNLWGGRRSPHGGYTGEPSVDVKLALVPSESFGHDLVIVSPTGEETQASTGKEADYPEYSARLHRWSPVRRSIRILAVNNWADGPDYS